MSFVRARFWCLFLTIVSGLLVGCAASDTGRESSEEDSSHSDPVQFADVTEEAGLNDFVHETGSFGEKWFPETVGGGGGFIDYDGDGWLDILLVRGGVWPEVSDEQVNALRLYENNGDGTFTEVTAEVGLGGIEAYGMGITVADYDNDGDEDFYFTTLHRNMLFRNEEGGFTEIGTDVGVDGSDDEWSTSAIFFDADNDGHLDLYVANYVDWSPEKDKWCTLDGETKEYCTPDMYEGLPNRYYHNNGDGTFTEKTEQAGFLPVPGNAFGIAALDYNNDGWTDLAIANDMQRNLLYENNGDGSFTERGTISGVAYGQDGNARAGMGIDAGYVESNTHPSIFVGNFTGEMIGVFRHTGEGLFRDRAAASKIGNRTLRTLTFGLFLFDVDLDGALDLFAANGHIKSGLETVQNDIRYRQQPQLFLNNGDGTFEEFDGSNGVFNNRLVARGAAYGDIDRDGDQDILITENGGPAHLWRNDHAGNHFLRVSLEGRTSNAEGLGSRIEAVTSEQRITRFVHTGSSYLSQSEKVVTLGLGGATHVDSLKVYWPSGQVDRFYEIEGNQHIRIVENLSELEPIAARPHSFERSASRPSTVDS
jgi:hypothetical protein